MSKKNLNVLIINYEFPPLGGGGGVATYDLAVEWARQGRVDVLTSSFKGLPSYEKVGDIHVHRVRIFFRKSRDAASFLSMLFYLPGAFFRGIRLMRTYKYDVINTHFAVPSGPVGWLLGAIFHVPNVLSLHGGDIYDPSKKLSPHNSFFFSRVVRFILNRADRIVAQSSNTRDNAVKYYRPKKKVDIIPLAFHPPARPKATRRGLGIDRDAFMLVTVGRLIKRKALDILIRAVAAARAPGVRLYIMGDGPEREFLETTARECGAGDRVVFLGYVTDEQKFGHIAVADLFTLTSLHEGFGIVFMESMYFGLPIVCTNNGGQTDFLRDGENALLVDVGDIDGCAAAIDRFASDRKLYATCSANNREAVKRFYAGAVAARYIDMFRDTAG